MSPADRGQLWGSLGENIQGSSQKGTGQRGPFWPPPWLTFKHVSSHEDSMKARAHSQMRLGVCWCPGWGDPCIQRSSAPVIHDVHTEAHMPEGFEQPLRIQLVSPRPGLWRLLGLVVSEVFPFFSVFPWNEVGKVEWVPGDHSSLVSALSEASTNPLGSWPHRRGRAWGLGPVLAPRKAVPGFLGVNGAPQRLVSYILFFQNLLPNSFI